jgi:hypothetical protein
VRLPSQERDETLQSIGFIPLNPFKKQQRFGCQSAA